MSRALQQALGLSQAPDSGQVWNGGAAGTDPASSLERPVWARGDRKTAGRRQASLPEPMGTVGRTCIGL